MKVLLRLVLLAGAAAALALVVREPLATRVAKAVTPGARALAELAPTPRGRASAATPPMVPMLPSPQVGPVTPVPFVPLLPHPPIKHAQKAPAPLKRHVVTRKELEDAIASRVGGANAVLVRDADGKPAGLRLSGVGRLAPFGVAEGDVLVAANGLPLRNADEALAALGALKDAKHVTVTLRRGTATYSVPIDLDDP